MTKAGLASALIQPFEGCRLQSYLDGGGVWTIGWGHTGKDVYEGLTIIQSKADSLMLADLEPLVELMKDRPILEAAAWISFGYNLGIGTLKKVLLEPSFVSVLSYNHIKGVVNEGLTRRRNLEYSLIAVSRGQ